jgi:broad specificity phosphatase PhoE
MKQVIWIARHGHRQDSEDSQWKASAQWPDDPGLSPLGIQQAKQLAIRLKDEKIDHIFASPFLRTIETANEVAELLSLPIKIEAGLSEWHRHEWFPTPPRLIPLKQKQERFPRIDVDYESHILPTHPETWEDVENRASKVAASLTKEFSGNLLLIGHGATVSTVTSSFIGTEEEIHTPICALMKIVLCESKWLLELNGDTSHLTG